MKVRYTRRAHSDVADIYSYIANDDPRAAQRVLRAIYEPINVLGRHPFVGIKNARAPGLRSRLVSRYPYRVHYLVHHEEVVILSVWHTARRSFEGER